MLAVIDELKLKKQRHIEITVTMLNIFSRKAALSLKLPEYTPSHDTNL